MFFETLFFKTIIIRIQRWKVLHEQSRLVESLKMVNLRFLIYVLKCDQERICRQRNVFLCIFLKMANNKKTQA